MVCYGDVDWQKTGKDMRQAIYILMEYNGEISYRTPAHITTDFNPDGSKDYDKVMAAIEELKVKHYI